MNSFLSTLTPVALSGVGFILPVYVIIWLRKREKSGRRSPLTAKLLRGPGTTLRTELEDAVWDVAAYLAVLMLFVPLLLSLHLSQSYLGGEPETIRRIVVSVVFAFAGIAYLSHRLYRIGQRRFKLQCAIEAETAVAQELDQLMRQGAIVFHDFPAEEFNIDHVVITRGAVFAVETKSRLKPDRGGGADDATVTFESDCLRFPGWVDGSMLDQARRQATWLSRWLSSAVGVAVDVKPVLALPGWFVDRKSRSDVRVISGREARSLMSGWRGDPLSDEMMSRIAHQVEQRCRDVEPTQYGRANKLGRNKRAV